MHLSETLNKPRKSTTFFLKKKLILLCWWLDVDWHWLIPISKLGKKLLPIYKSKIKQVLFSEYLIASFSYFIIVFMIVFCALSANGSYIRVSDIP